MVRKLTPQGSLGIALAMMIVPVVLAAGQSSGSKVFVLTDMEGVDGIFSAEDQCIPFKSPRWEESRKLLTGEVNAAVSGLFEGGATEVVVLGGHDSGRSLSRARHRTPGPTHSRPALPTLTGSGFFILRHDFCRPARQGRGEKWRPQPYGEYRGRTEHMGEW